MLGEARLDNFSPQASDANIRAFLIVLLERRKTGDVSH